MFEYFSPADPGAVETNIMRELPPCLSRLAFMVLRFLHLLQSPESGVDSILDAALAPPVSFLYLIYLLPVIQCYFSIVE